MWGTGTTLGGVGIWVIVRFILQNTIISFHIRCGTPVADMVNLRICFLGEMGDVTDMAWEPPVSHRIESQDTTTPEAIIMKAMM